MKLIPMILIYIIYFYIKSNRTVQYLQQNRYNRGNKFIKYIKTHLKKIYLDIELLFIPLLVFVYIIKVNYIYAFTCIYLFFTFIRLYLYKQEQKKIPLVYTKRVIRLYITLTLIYMLPFIINICLIDINKYVFMIILWLLMYLDQFVIIFANIINIPEEKLVGLYFKSKAINKLNNMGNLSVIGITGSYGKTSSKNILCDILNVKYNALASPKNFNTPYGLMMTINNHLDKFNDYFIAEMGACKKGEIKELCDLVHPKYGILTKIGIAHLETFGSEETIQKTKFELIESIPEDGIGILNRDDPKQVNYKGNIKARVLWIGIDNYKECDVYATDIKLSNLGTTFTVHFKNDKKKYEFTTKLLGKNNIYNILAGIALGNELGISKEQLIKAVKGVKPVEHRLELKRYYDMHLIDDAYNANPDGCKMALDVLKMMPGEKIVISSGMIELGPLADKMHKDLGKYMSDKVNYAILIGKEQTKYIKEGLIENKFNPDNIFVLNNVLDAFNLVNKLKGKDTYILLQSDLPDIFNEK